MLAISPKPVIGERMIPVNVDDLRAVLFALNGAPSDLLEILATRGPDNAVDRLCMSYSEHFAAKNAALISEFQS